MAVRFVRWFHDSGNDPMDAAGNAAENKNPLKHQVPKGWSGKRCRIRILKSLYINRITKERFRCTMLWLCAKSIRLLANVSAFSIRCKYTESF